MVRSEAESIAPLFYKLPLLCVIYLHWRLIYLVIFCTCRTLATTIVFVTAKTLHDVMRYAESAPYAAIYDRLEFIRLFHPMSRAGVP